MITEKQIEALKYLIVQSKDADDFAKRICFLLLEQSALLTKAVYITVTESETLPQSMVKLSSAHDMKSSGCDTHLNELIAIAGTDFLFSEHCGAFTDKEMFNPRVQQYCYTYWLSPVRYDLNASEIQFDMEKINSIELVSNLYKHSE